MADVVVVSQPQLVAFFVLCNLGQILVLAFLATVFVRADVKRRDGTVLNLCVAIAVWAVGANLLLYAGHFPLGAYEPHEPAFALCLVQALVIYAGITMSAAAVFTLVLHLWFSVYAPAPNAAAASTAWRGPLLVALPYCVAAVMFVVALARGLSDRQSVLLSRDAVYCSVGSPVGQLSASICGVFIFMSIVLEAHLGILVWRRRRARRSAELPPYFTVRLTVYSLYAVLTVIAALLLLFSHTFAPFIFMSTLPLVIFLLFGTGADILGVWFCLSKRDWTTPIESRGESTELSDLSRKERAATLLTSPHSMISTTAWDTTLSRPF